MKSASNKMRSKSLRRKIHTNISVLFIPSVIAVSLVLITLIVLPNASDKNVLGDAMGPTYYCFGGKPCGQVSSLTPINSEDNDKRSQ